MLLAVARAAAFALASVGGGLYEFLVVDPFWPKRPDLIQPARGGISRKRFWISIHVAFEKADPDAVSESKAVAWTRRSRLRLLGVRAGSLTRELTADAPNAGPRTPRRAAAPASGAVPEASLFDDDAPA